MLKFGCNYNNGVFLTQLVQHLQLIRSYSSSSSLSKSKVDPSSSYLVNYLVKSLGFSKQQSLSNYTKIAKSVSAKNANLSYTSFFQNADSVIQFFKQHDFELSHISKIVCTCPQILSANVDKTLKPKFLTLQELGFSGSDLVHTIVSSPAILTSRLSPVIETLRGFLGNDENVITFLKRSRGLYLSCATKYLIPNVELLVDYGIPIERIQQRVLGQPVVYSQKTESFRKTIFRVEHKLGIPPASKAFLSAIFMVSNFSDKRMEHKIDVYKSFGWTRTEVIALVRKNPHCFGLSDATIKNKLNFYMNELGYDPAYLVSHSFLLSCSLDKRVLPRYKFLMVLKEKGLIKTHYNLYYALCLSEPKFVKLIVLPHKEVHEVYAKLTGQTLKVLFEGQTCEDAIEL